MNLIKRSPKAVLQEVGSEFKMAYMDILAGHLPSLEKSDRAVLIGGIAGAAVFFSAVPAFAAGEPQLFTQVKKILDDYYGYFTGLVVGIFALWAIINAILMMIYTEDQAVSRAKKRIIRGGLCLLAIWSMGSILALMQSLTAGQGYTPGTIS